MFRLEDKNNYNLMFIFILLIPWHMPGPEGIKLVSCSTELSTNFQLLIKRSFFALSLSNVVFIILINVKMLVF